jgi:cytochrome c oxidase subunit 2
LPTLSPRHRSRLALLALAAGLVALLLLAPSAAGDAFTPESGGSPNADNIDALYKIVLYVGILMFLIVEGTLIWTLVRHRGRRGGPEPAQIRGNTPLELSWTIGAALILVVITVVTFVYLGDIQKPTGSSPGGLAAGVEVAAIGQAKPPGDAKTLEIGVNGQQYLWRYDYPDKDVYTYHDLVVPTNTTVTLKITSSDVVHSWWIPKLGGKMDAVPGYTNKTWFQIPPDAIPEGQDRVIYTGQCAELCGRNHANMYARVIGMRPDAYERWYADQVQALKTAKTDVAKQQRALTEQQRQGDGQ